MKTPVAWIADGLVRVLARLPGGHRAHDPADHPRLQFLVQALLASLFIACLVHALPWLTAPVDLPLRTLIANAASRMPAPDADDGVGAPWDQMAIITLDAEGFRARYFGESPLNRCTLADDLGALLATPQLHMLAIDLDLSPSTRRVLAPEAAASAPPAPDVVCANRLDALLRQQASRLRLILPLERGPLSPSAGPLERRERQATQAWVEAMRPGLQFARPELDRQFGMVRSHQPQSEPGLGVAWAQGICAQRGQVPASAKLDGYCASLQALDAELAKAKGHAVPARQISVHALVSRIPPTHRLALGPDTRDTLARLGVRYAILGAGYSPDDVALTPIGLLPGVYVHAAVASNPNEAAWHALDLALDVLLGIVFSYLVHHLWQRYFHQRLRPDTPTINAAGHPRLAYGWLVLLALATLMLAAVLQVGSLWALTRWGLWISPAGMLLGVLVDAFVTGGVHAAQHLGHDHAAAHPARAQATQAPDRPDATGPVPDAAPTPPPLPTTPLPDTAAGPAAPAVAPVASTPGRWLAAQLPSAAWLGLVGWTLGEMVWHTL